MYAYACMYSSRALDRPVGHSGLDAIVGDANLLDLAGSLDADLR